MKHIEIKPCKTLLLLYDAIDRLIMLDRMQDGGEQ